MNTNSAQGFPYCISATGKLMKRPSTLLQNRQRKEQDRRVRPTHEVPVQNTSLSVAIDDPGISVNKDLKCALRSVSRPVLGTGSLVFELQIGNQAVQTEMRDDHLRRSKQLTNHFHNSRYI